MGGGPLQTVELFSAIKLPSGLGHLIDTLLIKPKAAAIILKRAMAKANRNVPVEGRDAAALRANLSKFCAIDLSR